MQGILRVTDTLYTNIFSAQNQIVLANTGAIKHIEFKRTSQNYICYPSSGSLCIGTAATVASSLLICDNTTSPASVHPGATTYDLGSSAYRWNNVYGTNFNGTKLILTAPGSTYGTGTCDIWFCGSDATESGYITNTIYIGASTSSLSNLVAEKVYNAVWNDYAEMRKAKTEIPYGTCVIDNDDGAVSIATSRLMPGAQIVSDTWGHIMGETNEAKTPIAVAGRVLAIPYRSRAEYHAGQAVCSAPNGTVDIMSREEIMKYPDAIVGIVSEIPDYEEWGSGKIKVNNRIWIKIK